MKKKILKTVLVSSLFASTFALVGVGANGLNAAAMTEEVKPFTNAIGASVRISDPNGIRFNVQLTEEKKAEVFAEGSNKTLGVRIFPESYIAEGETDVDAIVQDKTVLDITFEETDLFEKDGVWNAHGVMTNLYLQSFNRDFVGIGYIATTVDDVTTYEYSDIALSDVTRSIADVAFAHYSATQDEKVEHLLEKAIYSAYGITETRNEGVSTYTKDASTWNSVEEIEAALPIALEVSDRDFHMIAGEDAVKLAPQFTVNGTKVTLDTDVAFTYTSTNDGVAKVVDGMVTAVGAGEATITVAYAGYSDSFKVTVSDAISSNRTVLMNGINMTDEYANGNTYISAKFNVTADLGNKINDPCLYITLGQRHIKIYKDGIVLWGNDGSGWQDDVSAIHAETARIYDENGVLVNDTIYSKSGKKHFGTVANEIEANTWYTLVIDMKAIGSHMTMDGVRADHLGSGFDLQATNAPTYVKDVKAGTGSLDALGITLDKQSAKVNAGETVTITPTLSAENEGAAIAWTSSNDAVATVVDGVVTTYKAGSAVITATVNGYKAVCTVEALAATIEIDEVQSFNYANLATNGVLDLKAFDITEEIFSVSVEGTNQAVFVSDGNGIVVTDNVLTIANNPYLALGISNVTVVVMTEKATYRIPLEFVQSSENFDTAQLLQSNADPRTLLMDGVTMANNYDAGKNFIVVKFFAMGDLSGSNRFYITLGQRHIAIQNDRITVPSWAGGWQVDGENVIATTARIFDENGNLVNDTIYNGGGGQAHGTVANTIEKGKWYTLVLDMNCKFTDWDTIRADNGSAFDMGAQNIDAYVTAATAMTADEVANLLGNV